MGVYDRDYFRAREPAAFQRLRMWSITSWLIGTNVAIFVLDSILVRSGYFGEIFTGRQITGPDGVVRTIVQQAPPLEALGHFSAGTAIYGLQLWRFITFQFLHANLQHLFFNMLGLYFFGQMIESYLGRRRFLIFYLICGVAGGLAYLALWKLHVLVGSAWVPLVGASAGIFGILAAAARVAPRTTVMMAFPPMPIELRTWAMVLLGIAAGTIIFAGANAGGEAAHLGGAIAGYLGISAARPRNRLLR